MSVLSLSGLSVGAGGRTLLAGLDISLEPGVGVGLIGPSGLGKTTLLRVVAGLADPLAGQILLRGLPAGAGGWPAFRRQVVLLAQKPSLLPGDVASNLARPFEYASSLGSFPEERARAGLRRLGLNEDCWQQSAESLSVGEQQRLCLLRALLVEPAVLLLDEPSSALDPESAETVTEMIDQERVERGLSLLLVSHDGTFRARLCQREIELSGFSPEKEA